MEHRCQTQKINCFRICLLSVVQMNICVKKIIHHHCLMLVMMLTVMVVIVDKCTDRGHDPPPSMMPVMLATSKPAAVSIPLWLMVLMILVANNGPKRRTKHSSSEDEDSSSSSSSSSSATPKHRTVRNNYRCCFCCCCCCCSCCFCCGPSSSSFRTFFRPKSFPKMMVVIFAILFSPCLVSGKIVPVLDFLVSTKDSHQHPRPSWRSSPLSASSSELALSLPLKAVGEENSTANEICPLYLNVEHPMNSSSTKQRNPCLCYGATNVDIFVDCTWATIQDINATLNHLRANRKTVRSLSIYRLNDGSDTLPLDSLPDSLFQSFNTITELHISTTNLTRIGTTQTYSGLEDSLHSLSFVNSRIHSIPKSTLSKLARLKQLDVQANRIANLDSYAFYGLPLRTLNLQNNLIKSLQEFAFGGLENTLEELTLSGNRLGNFPLFALRRLRKLSTLKLQNNLISQIPDDGFTRFTVLETLDLQSNQIRHLTTRSFMTMPKLKILYCSNNLLTVVSDSSIFAQLHYLETLDLSLNRLRVVNLDGLESIRTLDLSYNHLHDLRLQGMLGLRELFASNNNILQLINETFMNTTHLEVLYLQHNSIHTITYNALFLLQKLRILDLSFNQLRRLHASLFKYTNRLQSLYLDNNLITDDGLESGIFQELVDLRDLRLQHNMLRTIRKGVFYSLPNLQELDLQMNQIEHIESLESLANLQHLNLQGNRLATFNGQVLSSFPSSLRYLQLSHNRLESLQNDTFGGQNELEVVWLNHNNLKQITKSVFNDLIHVEKLYLDHNEINFVEDGSFSAMKSLIQLSLDHNHLGHLTRNMFKGLQMLKELRLASSEIIGIEPNMMEHLKNLEILDLSNNQLYTIRKSMFQASASAAANIQELYLQNVLADEIEVDSFENLRLLRTLDLSQNSINARRMNGIRLPPSIQILNISGNNLSNKKGIELSPEFIRQLNSSLEVLDLSRTHFQILNSQQFFRPLVNMQKLHLNSNEMIMIDNGSFPLNMYSLRTITMNGNRFDSVPSADILAKFAPNLQTLMLANNQIKKIQTNAFENFKHLEWLDLSLNRISVVESLSFNGLDRLTHLDLSGNVLRSISSQVFNDLPNLSYLSLANNWLQFIPNSLYKLNQTKSTSTTTTTTAKITIKHLDMSHNPMIRLREDSQTGPDDDFANLNTLNVQHGNISILATNDFNGMSGLTRLFLRHNLIQTISPSAFRPLANLIELDVSMNKLDNLPQERLVGLTRLLSLNLSHNSLTELPLFTVDVSNLQTLDISYNRISRIESFGHLSGSLQHLSLKHNMIGWLANNAFQNMTSLVHIDLRQNFLTQISEPIFESIEVRLQSIMLAGNPFHCDCRLLSIYQWLEEHSRLVKFEADEEMICDQPEKLKHNSIQSLQPMDFCPIPLITMLEVAKIEPSSVRLRWEVQNETLVGGFTLEYYLTSERSLTSPAGLQLNSGARTAELRDLVAEKWYTVCVEANGKYLRTPLSSLSLSSSSSASSASLPSLSPSSLSTSLLLDRLAENRPRAHYMIGDNNGDDDGSGTETNKKPMLQDFVTGNRKCSQIRTLSAMDGRKLISLPAASIAIALGIFIILILSLCIMTGMIFRFRRKRHQSQDHGENQERSATMVSFGSVLSSTSDSIQNLNLNHHGQVHQQSQQQQQQQYHHHHHLQHNHLQQPTISISSPDDGDGDLLTELDPMVVDDYITYRHFTLPSNEQPPQHVIYST